MATGIMDVQSKRDEILRIASTHGARNLRVFGSVARGEDRPDSDLDLLVDMGPGRSLLDLVALGQDLEDLLHRKVDVLTAVSVHPALRDRILSEARSL
jgi:predicted nucleotidyltransferase